MNQESWEVLKRYGVTPDNLSVGGYLDLNGTSITALPDNLFVGGSLYLRDTSITALPDNLSVGGYLDLRGTSITALPDNLSVGGYLDLSGTAITNYPVMYDCGHEARAIYLDLKDKSLCHIGCFKGTKQQAIEAISRKYKGSDVMYDYIDKVNQLFTHPSIK